MIETRHASGAHRAGSWCSVAPLPVRPEPTSIHAPHEVPESEALRRRALVRQARARQLVVQTELGGPAAHGQLVQRVYQDKTYLTVKNARVIPQEPRRDAVGAGSQEIPF